MTTQITKELLRMTREHMQQALDEVTKKHGLVNFKVGNCTFGQTGATFKVDIALAGQVAGKEADSFRQCCDLYGFKPEDLGATVKLAGKSYKIIGLKTRSKMPVIVEAEDQRQFRYPLAPVMKALGREVPTWLQDSPRV